MPCTLSVNSAHDMHVQKGPMTYIILCVLMNGCLEGEGQMGEPACICRTFGHYMHSFHHLYIIMYNQPGMRTEQGY